LELTRRRPHLVLLDEILPGESSLDLLAELKAQEVPVLLITGIVGRNQPIADGAYGRILKPTWKSLNEDRSRLGKSIFELAERLLGKT
jgi:DNA-binding NtrC family response regulator